MSRKHLGLFLLACLAAACMLAPSVAPAQGGMAPGLAEAQDSDQEGDLDAEDEGELRPIEGVFGFRLGDRFAPNAEVECRATRHGLVSCQVEPPQPSPVFTLYFLDLDPVSRTIAQISAMQDFEERTAYERARSRAVALLTAVFGPLAEHQGGLLVVRGETSAFLFGDEDDSLHMYGLTLLVTDDAAYAAAVERKRQQEEEEEGDG